VSDKPRLAGSTHAAAHTAMLQANLGLSREEAEKRTDEYLRELDRIADEEAARRQAQPAGEDEPPF
jgi:hypothetical protein